VKVVEEWVTFPNGDVEIRGFAARPADGRHPGLVVVPENIGLTDHRLAETAEMARHGFAVLALSLYSRIGGDPPRGPFASEDERRRANFLAMPDEQAVGDIVAAGAWLRRQPWVRGPEVGLLGFCSGGSQGFVTACTRPGAFKCLVSIYGNVVLPPELTPDWKPQSRLPLAPDLSCPMQGHYGTEDHVVPLAEVDAFDAELRAHDREHEFFRYPGAGHVFAMPSHPNHHAAATAEMWPRVYDFLERHLGGTEGA
jgi:carboxymethylenebutenolidase